MAAYVRTIGLIAALGLAVTAPTPANADKGERQKRQAKSHAQAAASLFQAKSYQKALSEFEKAYALFPVPALLYNMGQCQLFLGEYQKAIPNFEAFLSDRPSTPYREDVERLIREAHDELTKQERAAPPEPPPPIEPEVVEPPAPPPPPPSIAPPPPPPPVVETASEPFYTTWWFWTVLGGVAVAGGTAVAVIATSNGGTVLPMGELGVLDRR